MKHFPGRHYAEVQALECDITEFAGKGSKADYVENVLLPAAEQQWEDNLSDYGEGNCYFEFDGYSLSTVLSSAREIARQLDTLGKVDYSE